MNSDINLPNDHQELNPPLSRKQADIFSEMQQLGIDPSPFLILAAEDLFNQYGLKAKDYAKQAIHLFTQNEELDAVEIWQKISDHLDTLLNLSSVRAH